MVEAGSCHKPFFLDADRSVDASYNYRTLDFVIRVWLEERSHDARPLKWRGYVIQVMSGRKQYFQDLTELQEFVGSQIDAWRKQSDDERYE
jgi:hypothetical protein